MSVNCITAITGLRYTAKMFACKYIVAVFLLTTLQIAAQEGTYRVIDGPTPREGNLQVYHDGLWGYVCADHFGDREAAVFCHFLGMPGDSEVKQSYGFVPNSPSVWLDSTHDSACPNSWVTDLDDCFFMEWGEHNPDCDDQAIKCTFFNDALNDPGSEGEFRLTGGPRDTEGRLEVYHEGQWGTVCKDHFNNHAARVVCSEMGYEGTAAIDLDTVYASDGSGEIFLDDVQCTASDSVLSDCTHRPWREHDCNHADDVGVRCGTTCEPGYFGVGGEIPCSQCSIGSYQHRGGEDTCQACPGGETTAHAGSTDPSDCYPVGSGVNDPHFMITDAVTKQHLCFDYDGHDGDFIQLVADADNSVTVNGKLFAPFEDKPEHTYFSEIIIITKSSSAIFNGTDLIVNEAPLGWHFDGTYTDKDVTLRITTSRDHDRHTTVILETLDGSVSVYIQRNINDNFTFLGVYVGAVDGFSPQTRGIIGQFINRHFEILQTDENKLAMVAFDDEDVVVPVVEQLRYSPASKSNEPCYLYKHDDEEHAFIQQQHLL